MNCSAIHRLATLLLLVTPACAQTGPRADLVAIGRVWTGDAAKPWAEAVAVQGDTIVFVGDSAAGLGRVGDGTVVLRGALVTPGMLYGDRKSVV